jgi:hypothetical protein
MQISDDEVPEQDITGSCNESESCHEEPEHPHCQIHRQGYKKRSFVFPKESKKSLSAACARIKKELDQVPDSVHLNS